MDFRDKKNESKSHQLKIKTFRNGKDLVKFAASVYPEWIYDIADRYDDELNIFNKNWQEVCKRRGVSPQKILLVGKIIFESDTNSKDYTVLTSIQNHLTRYGYCVRFKGEFQVCANKEGCSNAILSEDVHRKICEKKK